MALLDLKRGGKGSDPTWLGHTGGRFQYFLWLRWIIWGRGFGGTLETALSPNVSRDSARDQTQTYWICLEVHKSDGRSTKHPDPSQSWFDLGWRKYNTSMHIHAKVISRNVSASKSWQVCVTGFGLGKRHFGSLFMGTRYVRKDHRS